MDKRLEKKLKEMGEPWMFQATAPMPEQASPYGLPTRIPSTLTEDAPQPVYPVKTISQPEQRTEEPENRLYPTKRKRRSTHGPEYYQAFMKVVKPFLVPPYTDTRPDLAEEDLREAMIRYFPGQYHAQGMDVYSAMKLVTTVKKMVEEREERNRRREEKLVQK